MAKAAVSPVRVIARTSPLAGVMVQGRFGADRGPPGVRLTLRHPLSLVTVIARKGKGKALAAALDGRKGVTVLWAGPEQYLVQAEGRGEGALAAELTAALTGLASVSDQSHGRVVFRIEGPKARAVLAKGTPVDLHSDLFPMGKSALTQMAHVGVHLTRVAADGYDLAVFRGFAESFWEWLASQSAEFGYAVG